ATGGRPPAGDRRRTQRTPPECGAALPRLRHLARGPEALRIPRPRAREHEGEERARQLRLRDDRSQHRPQGIPEVGGPVERTLPGQLMETLPTHWLSLVAVVFMLGLKHGLDADHLAAIDGLTRFNA